MGFEFTFMICKSYMDLDFEPWAAPLLAMVPYPIGTPMWTSFWPLKGLCGDTTIGNTVYNVDTLRFNGNGHRYFAYCVWKVYVVLMVY